MAATKTTKATKRKPAKSAPARKTCARCEKTREAKNFGTYARSADGLRGYCKDCVAEMRSERAAG